MASLESPLAKHFKHWGWVPAGYLAGMAIGMIAPEHAWTIPMLLGGAALFAWVALPHEGFMQRISESLSDSFRIVIKYTALAAIVLGCGAWTWTKYNDKGDAAKSMPSVDVVVNARTGAFIISNHGNDDVYMYGNKLGIGPRSIDKPILLTKAGYHIWGEKVISEIIDAYKKDNSISVPFEIYIKTKNGTPYVCHFSFWVKMRDNTFRIEAINLGPTQQRFD